MDPLYLGQLLVLGPLVPAVFLSISVASARLPQQDALLLILCLTLTSVNFLLYGYQQSVFNALVGGMAVYVTFKSRNSIASWMPTAMVCVGIMLFAILFFRFAYAGNRVGFLFGPNTDALFVLLLIMPLELIGKRSHRLLFFTLSILICIFTGSRSAFLFVFLFGILKLPFFSFLERFSPGLLIGFVIISGFLVNFFGIRFLSLLADRELFEARYLGISYYSDLDRFESFNATLDVFMASPIGMFIGIDVEVAEVLNSVHSEPIRLLFSGGFFLFLIVLHFLVKASLKWNDRSGMAASLAFVVVSCVSSGTFSFVYLLLLKTNMVFSWQLKRRKADVALDVNVS